MAALTTTQKAAIAAAIAQQANAQLVNERAGAFTAAGSNEIWIGFEDLSVPHAVDALAASAWQRDEVLPGGFPAAARFSALARGWKLTLANANENELLVVIVDGLTITAELKSGQATPQVQHTSLPPGVTPRPIRDGSKSAVDRRLVVYESSERSADAGRFVAIDPGDARGIAVPTAEIAPNLPNLGSVAGELAYESSTGRGYVWDGARWRDLAAGAVTRFQSEALLLADHALPMGAIAVAGDTGEVFVHGTDAAGQPTWRELGALQYADLLALLADTPGEGAMGFVVNEGSSWVFMAGRWRSTSMRAFRDTREVLDWQIEPCGRIGDKALARDTGVIYVRGAHGWMPDAIWAATAAEIQAGTDWPLAGQLAIERATGAVSIYAAGAWAPTTHAVHVYASQAVRRATTPMPPDGDYGVDLAGLHAYRSDNGRWMPLGPVQIEDDLAGITRLTAQVGMLAWQAPAAGQRDLVGGVWHVLGQGQWKPMAPAAVPTGVPLGSIVALPTVTPPNGFLLCDGAPIPAGQKYDALRALIGANTPNLTGQFLRGSATAAEMLQNRNWSTAFKATQKAHAGGRHRHTNQTADSAQFRGTTEVTGSHHQHWYTSPLVGLTNEGVSAGGGGTRAHSKGDGAKTWTNGADTGDNGAHTHVFVVPPHRHDIPLEPDHEHTLEGGDPETAPKHVLIAYHIKAFEDVTTITPALGQANQLLRMNAAGTDLEWVTLALGNSELKPPVPNAAALPGAAAVPPNANGDIRITLDTGEFHVWHSTPAPGAWNTIGPALPAPTHASETVWGLTRYATSKEIHDGAYELGVSAHGLIVEIRRLRRELQEPATTTTFGMVKLAEDTGDEDSVPTMLQVKEAAQQVTSYIDAELQTLVAELENAKREINRLDNTLTNEKQRTTLLHQELMALQQEVHARPKIVILTQGQYNALATTATPPGPGYDSNCLYFIKP